MSRASISPPSTAPHRPRLLLAAVNAWTAALCAALLTGMICRLYQLAPLRSAQISMGIFGFAGGVMTARAAVTAGADIDNDQSVLIGVIWSLVLMAAVTLLFQTSGNPLQMVIRAAAVFAVAGMAGGLLTLSDLRSIPCDGNIVTLFPGVLYWVLGFTAAAVVVSGLGPLLARMLPYPWDLMVGSVTAAVIIGAAAGLSIRGINDEQRPPWQGLARLEAALAEGRITVPAWAVAITAFPFYMNDYSNIYVDDWRLWLAIDYTAVKLFPFAIWLWVIKKGWRVPSELIRPAGPTATALAAFVVAALFGVLIDQNAGVIFWRFPGWMRLGYMPHISSPVWRGIDISIGLVMVAVTEEFLFRGVAGAILLRFTRRPIVIITASAVAFGLIHWSGGMVQVLSTATVGAIFMALYLETGSLAAVMAAHYVVDFVEFSGLVPKLLIRFM